VKLVVDSVPPFVCLIVVVWLQAISKLPLRLSSAAP
jgi:hypothetical protein